MTTPPPPPSDSGDAPTPPYGGGQTSPGTPSGATPAYPQDQYPGQQPYAQQPGGHQPDGQQPYAQQPYSGYPQQPPATAYGQGGDGYGQSRSTNTMALVSLGCGIAGFFTGIAWVAAIITGHMARKQIAQTGEEGSGFALAGLIMGYVGVALMVLVGIFFLLVFGGMFAAMGTAGYSGY